MTENAMAHFHDAQMEDLQTDPHRFGAPTFEEFCRNREKFMGRGDDIFTQVQNGSQVMRKMIKRQYYEIRGYKCNSLEEVERVAQNEGIALKDLSMRPELRQSYAEGKYDIVVEFVERRKSKILGPDGQGLMVETGPDAQARTSL